MGTASRIVVAQDARVWLARVGTTAPVNVTQDLPALGWYEAGFFTPDSLKWQTDPAFEEIRSHQSNYATRRVQTTDEANVEVDLQEWSAASFYAVYGGGTFIEDAPGAYRFKPPAIGERQSIAVIIEIIDGSKQYRRIVPSATQDAGVEQTFQRSSESVLPLSLSIVGQDGYDAWYDLTNDPAFYTEPSVLPDPVYPATTLWPSTTTWPQG